MTLLLNRKEILITLLRNTEHQSLSALHALSTSEQKF